jgi:hypothetical protein
MKTPLTMLIISTIAISSAKAQVNTPIASNDYFARNSRVFIPAIIKDEPVAAQAETLNNGEGPAGYVKCTLDNSSFDFADIVDVAYGANGKFKYMTHVAGKINFDAKTFGDPVPGVVKAGYYRIVPKKDN